MTDLILHHFDPSPFSEKIRLVLGLKQLNWKSVKVPVRLPKPVLDRRDERAGTVHVHVPRIGFQIKKAS